MNFLKRLFEGENNDLILSKSASNLILPENDGSVNFNTFDFENPHSHYGNIRFRHVDTLNKWVKQIPIKPKKETIINFFKITSSRYELDQFNYEDIFRAAIHNRSLLTLTPHQMFDCLRLYKKYLYDGSNNTELSFIFFVKLNSDVVVFEAVEMKVEIYMNHGNTLDTVEKNNIIVFPGNFNEKTIVIKAKKQ